MKKLKFHSADPKQKLFLTNVRKRVNLYFQERDISKKDNGAFRENLQTDFVERLITIATDESDRYVPTAESAAYYNLKKLRSSLASNRAGNEQTKAHRSHLVYMIDKGLSFSK